MPVMLSFICFTVWVILSINTYYVLHILMLVTEKYPACEMYS
jgi:hypothetical protein